MFYTVIEHIGWAKLEQWLIETWKMHDEKHPKHKVEQTNDQVTYPQPMITHSPWPWSMYIRYQKVTYI